MYCTKCGKMNVDAAVFCYACGAKIAIPPKSADMQSSAAATGSQPAAAPAAQSFAQQSVNAQPATRPAPVRQPGSAAPAAPMMRQQPVYAQTPTYYTPAVRRRQPPNVGGIVIASLLLISCFFPFITVGAEIWGSFIGTNYLYISTACGVLTASGAIAAIVFSALNMKWGVIAPGLASLGCYIASIFIFTSTVSYLGGSMSDLIGSTVHLKFGFFIVPIITIILIINGASMTTRHYYGSTASSTDSLISKLRDEGNSSGYWLCCNCGCRNALYVGTCKCGTQKTDQRNTVVDAIQVKKANMAAGEQVVAKCASCGRIVKSSSTFCIDCGGRLIRM